MRTLIPPSKKLTSSKGYAFSFIIINMQKCPSARSMVINMAGRRIIQVLLLAFVVTCGAQRISLCDQRQSVSSLTDWEVYGDDSRCSDQIRDPMAYRVIITSSDSSETNPLVMTVQQISNSLLQTVSLPFQGQRFGTARFLSVNHVVCPDLDNSLPHNNDTILMYINVFSANPNGIRVNYTLEVQPIPMFKVSFGQTLDITVGPATTQLHYFQSNDTERDRIIEVKASSVNDSCAIMSIQKAECPVILDALSNTITFRSTFQTMNQSATISFMNIEVGDAYFVLFTRVDDRLCDSDITTNLSGTFQNDAEFSKVITVALTIKRPVSEFGIAIVYPLLWFLAIAVVVTPFAICCSPIWKPCEWCGVKCTRFWDPFFSFIFNKTVFEWIRPAWKKCRILCGKAESFDVTDHKGSPSAASGDSVKCSIKDSKCCCKNKVNPVISDTYKKRHSDLRKRYHVYFWIVIAVFVFYVLPAVQVLLAFVDTVHKVGDQDLCYYNFKCSHPITLGSFLRDYKSFNSIWSNILFILFGLLFIFIVWGRDKRYTYLKRQKNTNSHVEAGQPIILKEHSQQSEDLDDCVAENGASTDYVGYDESVQVADDKDKKIADGIPQLPGIFYALGFALIGEGVMSSIYHICPTNRNFQFDTTFMFIIGGLLMIKIFQLRHPDRNKNAHIAYVMFSLVVFITLLGIYFDDNSPAVRPVLLTFVLLVFTCFLVSFYHHHKKWKWKNLMKIILCKEMRCLQCKDVRRFWRILIAFVGNVILVAIFAAGIVNEFASAILYLFIINAAYFSAIYVISKMLHRERTLTLLPIVFAVVGGVLMCFAIMFFNRKVYISKLSPSASRELNENCTLLGFYDKHDVWHFLSAFGLFFIFLFFLTIDDGVVDVGQRRLDVF